MSLHDQSVASLRYLCTLRPMRRTLAIVVPLAFGLCSCKDQIAPPDGTATITSASAPVLASAIPAASSAAPILSSNLALPGDDVLPSVASAVPSVSVAKRETPAPKPVAKTPPAATTASAAVATASAAGSAPIAASAAGSAPAAPASLPGGDPAAVALAARVDAIYVPKPNLAVRFKQEFSIRSTGQKKVSSGIMKFQRPGRMSWHYDPPNLNLVVCDGVTVTVFEGEGQQYSQQPFQASQYAGALGFLTGEGIRKYFSFKFHEVNNFPGGKVLLGTPLAPNPGYDFVLFYVDSATASIRRVIIIDAQRNKNRFDFESVSEAAIDAKEFVWLAPPGATRIAN